MTESESIKSANSGVRWSAFGIGFIVGFIGWLIFIFGLSDNLSNDNFTMSIAVAIAVAVILSIVIYFVFGNTFYVYFLRLNKKSATCPSCGKSYCIEHTREETISESIITEKSGTKSNVKFTNYRVGVKRIYWRCKECGKSDDGEVEYKEKID